MINLHYNWLNSTLWLIVITKPNEYITKFAIPSFWWDVGYDIKYYIMKGLKRRL